MDEGRVLGMLGARADTTGTKSSKLEGLQRTRQRGGEEDGGSDEEDRAAGDDSIQRMQVLLGTAEHLSEVGGEDSGERE